MDSSNRSEASLTKLLQEYARSISSLNQDEFPQKVILETLLVRDAIQSAIQEKSPTADDIWNLDELDLQLKKHAHQFIQSSNIERWKAVCKPDNSAWWWHPQELNPKAHSNQNGLFLNGLVIIFLAISASLILNTASRFWVGGIASTGTLAIATQSLLTLIVGKGALTVSGREAWEGFLKQRHIPEKDWQRWSCIAAGGVFLTVAGIHWALPWFATWYNASGNQHLQNHRLSSAQNDFRTALSLRPDYSEANFNLGLVHESLQEVEQAKASYQLVVARDIEEKCPKVWLGAHNNLARLYVIEGKLDQSVYLLFRALDQINLAQTECAGNPENVDEVADINYSLLKNLGWVRLEQQRYVEADKYLREALDIDPQKAAAPCLLAQVLDAQDNLKEAGILWKTCRTNANLGNIDEDSWIGIYERRMQERQIP